ncbi:MAG: EamA family transporter RarD [Jatrophihabitantaceae bacterium]
MRTENRRGLVYGFSAYLLWGLFPLYWPLLKPAGALEILAQRMVWSLLLIVVVLVVMRNLAAVRLLVADRGKLARLTLAAVLVSVNWGVYIWAVNSGHVIETSLGYFINPLFTIMLGVLVLKERLSRAQWIAVGIATLAIVVLTVDYGRLPWIALTLAFSFGCYGFLKKQVSAGAVETLAVETAVMAGPALLTLIVLTQQSELAFGHHGAANALLLIGTGAVTAIPLLLFGAAARRLPLTSIGLLQYLAPMLQFGVGVGIRHEPMPPARLLGFALVWVALVVLTADALKRRHREANLVRSAEAIAA